MVNYFAKKIKGFKTVYLAGGIQRTEEQEWRFLLEDFFKKNRVKVYNPLTINKEILKSLSTEVKTWEELKDKSNLRYYLFLKLGEKKDEFIIKNMVDLIIFYLNGKEGFGTWTELKWVYDLGKTFIIVREEGEEELPDWIKWRRYFALMEIKCIEVRSLTALKEFFTRHLGFKD